MKDWSKLQVNNFIFKKREEKGIRYVSVHTSSGDFGIEFRQDTKMYSLISSVSKDDKEEMDGLAVNLYNAYFVANIVDQKMQRNVLTCVGMYMDGEKNKKSDISKEEDDRILEEERRAYMLRKEMEQMTR